MGPIRVLLVEDDPDEVVLLDLMLQRLPAVSFALVHAATLSEAVSRVREGGIDVVVLDLSLPDSRGFETFVRFHASAPGVPTIIHSGSDDEAVAIRAVREGAQDYLIKGQVAGALFARTVRYAVERQRSQAALSAQSDLLKSLIASIPDEVYVKDTAGRFVLVNPVTLRSFGLASSDAIIGKTDFDFFPRELAEQFKAEEQALLRRDQPCVNREAAVTDSEGRTRWVLTTKVPLRDRDGNATGLLGINRDITPIKTAEQELRRMNENLEQRVILRTANLREAMGRLEAHDRARAEFISNVSHELRTPLASMKLGIDNMLSGIPGPQTEASLSYLGMLKEDCCRLFRTVNDILDMSRIEAGKMRLRRVKLPFGWLACRVIESLRAQAGKKHLALRFVNEDGARFAACDPEKMERVITNVVGNAIKFTPAGGGVDVTLRAEPGTPERVVFEVADTGVGIPAEHLPHICERYYRVGEHISGTGLGLCLAREMVQLHGGEIVVASPRPTLTCGTVVSIRLPAVEPPTILVVGNEPEGGDSAAAVLEKQGYAVVRCGTVAEALAAIRLRCPEAAIVDFASLGDGVQLIADVKASPGLRNMAVLAITGGEIDDMKRNLLEGFAIPVLARPWIPEELYDRLVEAIVGKRVLEG